jgi:hypothetical protein
VATIGTNRGETVGIARADAAGWRAGWRGWVLTLGLFVLMPLPFAASVARILELVSGWIPERRDDFAVYWQGAATLAAGGDPYGWLLGQEEPLKFVHPPLPPPLTVALDYATVRWLWLGFSALCLLAGLTIAWRVSGALWRADASALLLLLAFYALLPETTKALDLGQVSPQLLLIAAGAYAALRRGRPVLAGAVVATGAYLKAFPALLAGFFLLRGRRRALGAAAVCDAGLVGLTIPFLGPESWRIYLTGIRPAHRDLVGVPFNVSLTGLLTRLTGPTGWTSPAVEADALGQVAILVASASVLAATAYAVWRAVPERPVEDAAYGALVTTSLLTTAMNSHYNIVVFLALAIVTARLQADWPRQLRWLLLALLLLRLPVAVCDFWGVRDVCLQHWPDLSPEELPWRQGWGNLIAAGPLLGMLVLWGLLLRLGFQRPAPPPSPGPVLSERTADMLGYHVERGK